MFHRVIVPAATGLLLASCGPDGLYSGGGGTTCDGPCGQAPPCAGTCVPAPPAGWAGPELTWIGSEVDTPACPDSAPTLAYEGHAKLEHSIQCGECACGPPSCKLPNLVDVLQVAACPPATSSPRMHQPSAVKLAHDYEGK